MFDFLPGFDLSHFTTSFDYNDMHLSTEEPLIRSRELLPDSKEGRTIRSEEVRGLRGATDNLVERQKAKIDAQKAEIFRLRNWKERYAKRYREAKERISELEHDIGKVSDDHQETLEKYDRRIRAMADHLERTEELLAARSAELAGAQYFLSTTDRLSEADVLSIVRDLNENIFQVAANLTEEWEKLGSSRTSRFDIDQRDIDSFARFYGPALIQSAIDRDPAAVTFLVQSCLCYLAMKYTSSWRHDQELATLGSVYKRLSDSGRYTSPATSKRDSRILEGQAISARWRSLTHSYLSEPPPHSASIVKRVADVLWITGSFSSPQRSIDLVKTVALSGLETIDRLALRLDTAFMVEVASSDMSLVFETPLTVFDETRMTNEFGSDEASTPGRRDKVAGTTEVGVKQSVCGGRDKGRRTEVLLKTKVVLEKDVVDL